MSLKNLALNLVLVAATSLVAAVLAGYMGSAAMARVAHGSHISKTLASHDVMVSPIPQRGPRHVGLLSLPQSATDAVIR